MRATRAPASEAQQPPDRGAKRGPTLSLCLFSLSVRTYIRERGFLLAQGSLEPRALGGPKSGLKAISLIVAQRRRTSLGGLQPGEASEELNVAEET